MPSPSYYHSFYSEYFSWLSNYTTSWKVAGSNHDEIIGFFFNLPNPSSRTMASNRNEYRNILGGKGRPARRADNLTAIYEPIV
jgi:hypothetical protein